MSIQMLNIIIFLILIGLILLHRDASRYAETSHIIRLNDDNEQRMYIASGVTDRVHEGAKILLILYSLFCRKCKSTNIFVDLDTENDFLVMTCRDCGMITRIKLTDLMLEFKEAVKRKQKPTKKVEKKEEE